jgi:hypothetical protein
MSRYTLAHTAQGPNEELDMEDEVLALVRPILPPILLSMLIFDTERLLIMVPACARLVVCNENT